MAASKKAKKKVKYTKPSFGRRRLAPHRILHYLENSTSASCPEWRDATIFFLHELYEIMEENPAVILQVFRDDGIRIYHKAKPIVYMHLRQRHFLVMTKRDYLLYTKGNRIFADKREGAYPRMWRATGISEVKALLAFIKKLRKFTATEKNQMDSRSIPQWVRRQVMERDKGKCQHCGSKINLQFDHIIPYSLGGCSSHPNNVQLLCAKCNLEKSATLKY